MTPSNKPTRTADNLIVVNLPSTQSDTKTDPIINMSEGENVLTALGVLIDELIALTHGQKQRHVNQNMKNIIDRISQLQKQALAEFKESTTHSITQPKRGRTMHTDEPIEDEHTQQQIKRTCTNSPKPRANTNLIGRAKRSIITNDRAIPHTFEGAVNPPSKRPKETQQNKGNNPNDPQSPKTLPWNTPKNKTPGDINF